ncbi:AlpA family transcriptional regulator [Cryobacterium sp. TMS1-20-1]|uniref:helix-turn-helix transcriptional regulator n=1 Tax=Cryobacterium sp. TMS1-20-1 TaxID=1259223 RepID=UPI00158305C2|nr:helix-turn-helix domain-containing protein [Cryobacterium sp. TMS1-20-1]
MTTTPRTGATMLEAALRQIIREEVLAVLAEVEPAATATPGPQVRTYTGPRSLTPAEVAEKTGLATQTLANWRGLGEGPAFYKVGRLVRYDQVMLDVWMAERRSGPTPKPHTNHTTPHNSNGPRES